MCGGAGRRRIPTRRSIRGESNVKAARSVVCDFVVCVAGLRAEAGRRIEQ